MPTNSLRRAVVRWRPLLVLAGASAAAGATVAAHGASRAGATATTNPIQDAKKAISANFARVPLSFEPNRGQVGKGVDFISRGPGYTLYLAPDRSAMTLLKAGSPKDKRSQRTQGAAVGMRLLGSNPNAKGSTLGAQPGRSNYFLGKDTSKWAKDVPHFDRVKYEAVYPGIDLVYYGTQRQLEYDFVVKPGADESKIRFMVAGPAQPRLDKNGDLVMPIAGGGEVRQQRPIAYQVIDGKQVPVAAQYRLKGRNVEFALGRFDKTRELVIDPVLTYSTYIGGSLDDYGLDIAVDATGNAYLTGYTGSFPRDPDTQPQATISPDPANPMNSIVTPQNNVRGHTAFPLVGGVSGDPDPTSIFWNLDTFGNRQPVRAQVSYSYYDTFIAKLNPAGNGLVYSTYIGAPGDDYGTSIAVDSSGAAYITGLTLTSGWPLVRPIQATNGGSGDAYALKLNPAGNGIVYSTFLGGSGLDYGRAISVDSQNNCVIAGLTSSTNFPIVNAFQPANAGSRDYFVLSINNQGSALTFSTYFGGAGDEGGIDFTHAYPTTIAWNFNPNGNGRGTYLAPSPVPPSPTAFTQTAGNGRDYGVDIATDARGYVYLTGTTAISGANIAATPNAFQGGPQGIAGTTDAFVAKLSPTGQLALPEGCYVTYVGGSSNDGARGIAVDIDGAAYITGYAGDGSFPVTIPSVPPGAAGRRQEAFAGGTRDAFVFKLNPNGTDREWSTFVGGSGNEEGCSVAVNAQKRVHVVGNTTSTNLPLVNQLQSSRFGSQDAFVLKLDQNADVYEYITYYGSDGQDWGFGIAVDPNGIAYITGVAKGDQLPVTQGALQGGNRYVNDGNYLLNSPKADLFVARIANPPLAPTNLTVTAVTTNSVSLNWNDNADSETNYIVERRTGNGVFVQINPPQPANTVAFTDNGLISGVEYSYRVYAVNAEGGSGYSNTVTVTTLPTTPTAPNNLTVVTAGKGQLRLAWGDNSNNETGFRIERRQLVPVAGATIYAEIFVTQPNAATYTDNNDGLGLPPNVTYEYRVRATNSGGDSAYTNSASRTTLPEKPTLKPVLTLQVPATNAHSEIVLSIDYPQGGVQPAQGEAIVDGFNVYRSTDGVQFNLLRVVTLPPPAITVFPVTGIIIRDTALLQSTRYHYRVAAFNFDGAGPQSDPQTRRTATDPPSNVVATPSSPSPGVVQIVVTWLDNALTESGYELQRSRDGGANWVPVPDAVPPYLPAVAGSGTTATFTDTAVAPDTRYRYRVRSINGSIPPDNTDPGTPSDWANGTDVDTAPFGPSALSVFGTNSTTVRATFTDNSILETGFRLYRRTLPAGVFAAVSTVMTPSAGTGLQVIFNDATAATNTAYEYQVVALNLGGESPASNVDTVSTVGQPTGLTVTAKAGTTDTLVLNWTDTATTETDYRVLQSTDGVTFAPAVASVNGAAVKTLTLLAGIGANSTEITGLLPNTQYYYQVQAYNADADSTISSIANAFTLPTAPVSPTARALNTTTVEVQFTDTTNVETSFRIYRSDPSAPTPALVKTVAAVAGLTNVITDTDTTAVGEQTYSYTVRTVNPSGESADSAPVVVVKTMTGPTQLMLVPDVTTVAVTFRDNTINEDGYDIERSIAAGGPWAVVGSVGVLAGTGTTGSFPDSGLAPNTTYHYRVRAKNGTPVSFSDYSAVVNTVTLAPPPINVTAAALSTTSIEIRFTDQSTGETGFRVYRSTAGGPFIQVGSDVPAAAGTGTVVIATDGSVGGETTYAYQIRTLNGAGQPGPVSADSNNVTTMNAPTALVVTPASTTTLSVQWTDNTAFETSYIVEFRPTGTPAWLSQSAGAVMGTLGTGSATVTGLTQNTRYDVRVRASNATGFSTFTATATRTTLAPAPNDAAAVAIDSNSVRVTFTDPLAGETGFRLYRSNGGAPSLVASIGGQGGGTITIADDSAPIEADLVYVVRTLNLDGDESLDSNNAPVSTMAAPTILVPTVVSQTRIDVNFRDNSNREGLYEVEISANGVSGWTVAGTTPGAVNPQGSATVSINGLTANTTYFFRVRARNGANFSDYSAGTSGTTLKIPPAAPTQLTGVALSQTSVRLTWTDNADNEDGFKVERSVNNFTSIDATLPINQPAAGTGATVTFVDNTAVDDTVYQYRVRAFNNGGDSGPSNTVTVKTPAYPPFSPTNLTTQLVSRTQINLTWTDKASNEQGFIIDRATDGLTFRELTRLGPSVGVDGTVLFEDRNLLADRNYTYKVRAYNDGGNSASDAGPSSKFTPPAAPSNLVFTSVTNNTIRIFWVDNSTTAQRFIVERSTEGGAFLPVGSVNVPSTTFADTGLSGQTAYAYRVKASNGSANAVGSPIDSDYSNTIGALTLPDPPAAPSLTSAIATSQTQASITWIDLANNEDGYNVYRSRDTAVRQYQLVSVKNGSTPGTGSVLNFTDNSLTANTGYVYIVRAFNNGGESPNSNEGVILTPPFPPVSPANLTVSGVTDTSITLQWQDNANNEDGFLLERSLNGVQWEQVGSNVAASPSTGGIVSVTDSGLTADTSYRYRVSAFNTGGTSGFSNIRTVKTLPSAPTNLEAAAQNDGSIVLTWTAGSTSDGYRIFRRVAGGAFIEARTVGAGATTATDVPPTAGTTYTYQVVAYNASGNSQPSNTADAIAPFVLLSVRVNDPDGTLRAGKNASGTLTLNGPAPTGGVAVAVRSSNDVIRVPAIVRVPAGQSSVNFTVRVGTLNRRRTVTITASLNGVNRTANVAVKP